MATNKIFIPYYISNNTGAPAQVLPRVFFYNGLKESDPYYIQFWTTSSFGKTVIAQEFESFPYFDNYSGQETTTSSLSLLFLNEDVAYGNSVPSQSLYDLYWSKYVDLLYNPRTRIIRLSAVLPFPVYIKLELNDVIQLRSNYYHLRAINDYNLKTGECRMELLGPLLEGSLNNTFTFDNTCEQAPSISGSILNDTGSRQITFNITGSNCCNNPNSVVVRAEFGTGSCPQTASLTSYVTLPNVNPIVVNYASLLVGYPTVNCVTMSVANLCYGLGITGSYSLVFTGSLSGSFGNVAISASAQKNNCPVCQTGSFYTTIVSSGTFNSTASQANADAQAVAYLTSVSQSNANTFGSCSINYYFNTQISSSIQKNDCTICQTGSFVTYTIPISQSQYTSTCSLADAQNNAQTYFNSTSQSYANTNGTCTTNTYYNTQLSASVTRNNCLTCETGSTVLYTVAASSSLFTNTCSLNEAQTSASIYFAANSQSYANTNGTCIVNYKYSTAISASVQRNNCPVCHTGSFVNVQLAASYSFDSCSQATAQATAQLYFNSISQSQANTNGTCSFTTFYSLPISASVQKNNCTGSLTGSYSWVSVPISQSNSTCSLVDAQDKAQVYFNANSQSFANSSGYCYDVTGSFRLYNDNIDISDSTTSSIFPLTASIIVTSSATYPSETSPYWNQVYWFSQSLASYSMAGFNSVGWVSGSGDPYVYVKIRTKNGGKVNTAGPGGGTRFMLTSSQNELKNYGLEYDIDCGRIFENNGISSVATSSIALGFVNNGNTSSVITASFLYSTNASFPSISGTGWNVLGYSYSGSGNQSLYYSASFSGSPVMTTIDSYMVKANFGMPNLSSYVFLKFQSGSTYITASNISTGSGTTSTVRFVSASDSGMWRMGVYLFPATDSDGTTCNVNLTIS